MKRLWKRWLCAMLVMALLAVFPVSTFGEEDVMEWTYDNSIVVTVSTDTPQQFTPEDFPEINCKRVVAVSKSTTNERIFYQLVLVLWDSGEYHVEKAMEIAQKDPKVTHVEKNTEYRQFKSWIKLNHSEYTLKIGQTVDLQMADSAMESFLHHKIGVFFNIDPTMVDNSNITKSSFEQYGVHHFWPCHHDYPSFFRPDLDDTMLEGCKSETGEYYAVADADSPALEMADRLARTAGIACVRVEFADPITGPYWPTNYWKSEEDTEIISLSLSSPRSKIATIRGLTPGSVTVTLTVNDIDVWMSDSCVIQVVDEYQDGDINRDGDIDASDALLALQHSVGLITLDAESRSLADMDGNGEIDAADALTILQISVGLFS